MKVKVTVVLDVDWCEGDTGTPETGTYAADQLEEAVAEAVANALHTAHTDGFDHAMDDKVSILCDNPVTAEIVR